MTSNTNQRAKCTSRKKEKKRSSPKIILVTNCPDDFMAGFIIKDINSIDDFMSRLLRYFRCSEIIQKPH